MGNLTRGNLLATIKSLKKHKRPKVVVANASVQAICGGSVPKPDKSADLKATLERRKALFVAPAVSLANAEDLKKFDADFAAFMARYWEDKKRAVKEIALD